MHVAHLTLPFEYACGISRHVWTLAREQRGDRVTVLTSGGGGTSLLDDDGIPWMRMSLDSASRAPWGVARAVAEVAKFAKEEEVTVLHAHHRYHALVARLVGVRLPKVRLVVTCHSIVSGARLLSYPVPQVIAVSAATRDHLHDYFGIPLERITVIPNALPAEPATTAPLDPLVSAAVGRRPVILAAGRLSAEKGFDIYIRALSKLRHRDVSPLAVLIGAGPEKSALEKLARREGVTLLFTGALPTVRGYLAAAQVVVQPSRTETSSLMALQAGWQAKPIVATAVDGLPETVEHGRSGILVPPDDPSALAAAIDALLDDPELASRLGAALRERVRTVADPGAMAAATRRVYTMHNGAA